MSRCGYERVRKEEPTEPVGILRDGHFARIEKDTAVSVEKLQAVNQVRDPRSYINSLHNGIFTQPRARHLALVDTSQNLSNHIRGLHLASTIRATNKLLTPMMLTGQARIPQDLQVMNDQRHNSLAFADFSD